jgi:hypothetical protein
MPGFNPDFNPDAVANETLPALSFDPDFNPDKQTSGGTGEITAAAPQKNESYSLYDKALEAKKQREDPNWIPGPEDGPGQWVNDILPTESKSLALSFARRPKGMQVMGAPGGIPESTPSEDARLLTKWEQIKRLYFSGVGNNPIDNAAFSALSGSFAGASGQAKNTGHEKIAQALQRSAIATMPDNPNTLLSGAGASLGSAIAEVPTEPGKAAKGAALAAPKGVFKFGQQAVKAYGGALQALGDYANWSSGLITGDKGGPEGNPLSELGISIKKMEDNPQVAEAMGLGKKSEGSVGNLLSNLSSFVPALGLGPGVAPYFAGVGFGETYGTAREQGASPLRSTAASLIAGGTNYLAGRWIPTGLRAEGLNPGFLAALPREMSVAALNNAQLTAGHNVSRMLYDPEAKPKDWMDAISNLEKGYFESLPMLMGAHMMGSYLSYKNASAEDFTKRTDGSKPGTDHSADIALARAQDPATASFIMDQILGAKGPKQAEMARQRLKESFAQKKEGDYFHGRFDEFFPPITVKNWTKWGPQIEGVTNFKPSAEPTQPATGNAPLATTEPINAPETPVAPTAPFAPTAGPARTTPETGGEPLQVPGSAAADVAPAASPEVGILADQVQRLEQVHQQAQEQARLNPQSEKLQSKADEAMDLLQAAKDHLEWVAPGHPLVAAQDIRATQTLTQEQLAAMNQPAPKEVMQDGQVQGEGQGRQVIEQPSAGGEVLPATPTDIGQAKTEGVVIPRGKSEAIGERVTEEGKWIESNPTKFDELYNQHPDTANGKILSWDAAADVLPSVKEDPVFGHGWAQDSGSPQRAIMRMFNERMKESPATTDEAVMIMVGNAGAGKTTLAKRNASDYNTVLDATGSDARGLIEDINSVLRSGRKVDIVLVHAPIEEVVARNVKRQGEQGRPVPIENQATLEASTVGSFLSAWKTFGDPAYANDVGFALFENRNNKAERNHFEREAAAKEAERISEENGKTILLDRAAKAYIDTLRSGDGNPSPEARSVFEQGISDRIRQDDSGWAKGPGQDLAGHGRGGPGVLEQPAPPVPSAQAGETQAVVQPHRSDITPDGGRKFTVGGAEYTIPPSQAALIKRYDAAAKTLEKRHQAITDKIGSKPVRARLHERAGANFAAEKLAIADALSREDWKKEQAGAIPAATLLAPVKAAFDTYDAVMKTGPAIKAMEGLNSVLESLHGTVSPGTVNAGARLMVDIKAGSQSARANHLEQVVHQVKTTNNNFERKLDPNMTIKIMDIIEGKTVDPDGSDLRGLLNDAFKKIPEKIGKRNPREEAIQNAIETIKLCRDLNDKLHQTAVALGSPVGFVENYWQRNWKKEGKSLKAQNSSKILEGTKSWTKERVFPYFSDAIEAGFEPVSWNPIKQFLHGYADAMKYVCDRGMVEQAKAAGLLTYVRNGGPQRGKAPEGKVWLADKLGPVWTRSALVKNEDTGKMEWKKTGALNLQGWWTADPYVARILNRMVAKGIRDYREGPAGLAGGTYRGLRTVQLAMTQSLLGLSAFHLITIANDAQAQALSDSAQSMINGELKNGTLDLGRFASIIGPVIENLSKGLKLRSQMLDGTADPEFVKWFNAGGGRIGMDSENLIGATGNLVKAWRRALGLEGSKPWVKKDGVWVPAEGATEFYERMKASMKVPFITPFAMVEAAMAPIMKHFVPVMKLQAAKIMLEQALARLPEDATDWMKARVARSVIQHIENRMGEMTWDNLNLHPIAKDLLQATFLATTWNYGSAALFDGGILDVVRAAQELGLNLKAALSDPGQMDAIRKKIKEDHEQRGEYGKAPWFTRNISHVTASMVTFAIVGGLLTYLLTGSAKRDKDKWYMVRTGAKDRDGKDEYMTIPGYGPVYADLFAVHRAMAGIEHEGAKGWKMGAPTPGPAVDLLGNKLSPVVKDITQLWRNSDWTGNRQIYDPKASFLDRQKQKAEYLLRSNAPITVRNLIEKHETQTWSQDLKTAFLTKPRKELTDSYAESVLRKTIFDRQPKVIEKAKVDRDQMLREAKDAYVMGNKDPLGVLQKEGLITPKEFKSVVRSFQDKSLIERLSSANSIEARDLIDIWDNMTPEEKLAVFPAMAKKMGTTFKSTPPNQKDALKDNLKRIKEEVSYLKEKIQSSQ